MSDDLSPDGPEDIIDFSGTPRSMGEKRDYGFAIMKRRMLEIYAKKMQHVQPMIRAAKMQAYEQAMNDTFNVFAQIIEVPTDEEITPGI